MTLDITKPVQTRDGKPARIVCTDMKGTFPVVALVTQKSGNEVVNSYDSNGVYHTFSGKSDNDLVNIPERVERWLNVYPPRVLHLVETQYEKSLSDANSVASMDRIGILHFVYENDKVVSAIYKVV